MSNNGVRGLCFSESRAFDSLYGQHARAVSRMVSRLVRDPRDVEEVVQDVFLQVWRQASRFDAARGGVQAWIRNIARSRAIDRARSRQRARREGCLDDLPELLVTSDTGESRLAAHEAADCLRHALQTLPMPQRQALELAWIDGLTHGEIAARLRQPMGTVKGRIRAGAVKIRRELRKNPVHREGML